MSDLDEQFFSAPPNGAFAPKRVEIGPDVGYVAKLNALERDDLFMRIHDSGQAAFRVTTVAYCICDSTGRRFYTDRLEEGIEIVGAQTTDLIESLYDAADEHNNIRGKKKASQPAVDSGGD